MRHIRQLEVTVAYQSTLLFGLLLCGVSQAQTACPPGMEEYGAGVCGYSRPDEPTKQAVGQQAPPPQWASRWLAVATDSVKGTLGSATDMQNRENAEQAAIADCQAKGGTKCKLDVSYSNGCAAMVVGDGGYNSNGAATENEAIQLGMKVCMNAGHTKCHVYYAVCSPPARIQ